MNVILTGRHINLDDDIKSYAEKKLLKAETFFDHIIEAHIVLSAEKHRRIAEVTLNVKNATFHATAETDDFYSAVDAVMEKVDVQIKKFKERIKDRKHRVRIETPIETTEVEITEDPEMEESDTENSETNSRPQIVKVKRFAPKPMTPQEAVMQLDVLDDDFMMFSNSQTNQVNVIYKRKDGSYGWIEPDFE